VRIGDTVVELSEGRAHGTARRRTSLLQEKLRRSLARGLTGAARSYSHGPTSSTAILGSLLDAWEITGYIAVALEDMTPERSQRERLRQGVSSGEKGEHIMMRRRWIGIMLCTSLALVGTAIRAQETTQAEKEKAVAYLETTKKGVLDGNEKDFLKRSWNFKAAPDKWSVAQCAEHIAPAEDSFAE